MLRGALQQGVPIAHACGGQARCTTCRVHVLEGAEHRSVRTEAEAALARRGKRGLFTVHQVGLAELV